MMSARRAVRMLRDWGWQVDCREETMELFLGPTDPLPTGVAWGHPDYPPSSPLWLWAHPRSIHRSLERVFRVRPHDAQMLLDVPTDLRTWRALCDAAGLIGERGVMVVSAQDLRRGVARLVTTSEQAWGPGSGPRRSDRAAVCTRGRYVRDVSARRAAPGLLEDIVGEEARVGAGRIVPARTGTVLALGSPGRGGGVGSAPDPDDDLIWLL
jgi:hypothetical protein